MRCQGKAQVVARVSGHGLDDGQARRHERWSHQPLVRVFELVAELLDSQLAAKEFEPHARRSWFQVACDAIHDAQHGQKLDHAQTGHALLVLDDVHFSAVRRAENAVHVVQPRALFVPVQQRDGLSLERVAVVPASYIGGRRPRPAVADVVHGLVHLRAHEQRAVHMHGTHVGVDHERDVLVTDGWNVFHVFCFIVFHIRAGVEAFFFVFVVHRNQICKVRPPKPSDKEKYSRWGWGVCFFFFLFWG